MFISKFLSDANFGLASFTVLVYSMINYNNNIDHFTNNDGDRSNFYDKGTHSFNVTIWITLTLVSLTIMESVTGS